MAQQDTTRSRARSANVSDLQQVASPRSASSAAALKPEPVRAARGNSWRATWSLTDTLLLTALLICLWAPLRMWCSGGVVNPIVLRRDLVSAGALRPAAAASAQRPACCRRAAVVCQLAPARMY